MKKPQLNKNILHRLLNFLTLSFLFISFIDFDGNKNITTKASTLNKKQTELVLKASISDKERKLPLYGFNGNNVKGPSWTNSSFRDAAASLHFKIIRYPGGTVCNWWDWQKGWFVDNPALPDKFKKMRYVPNGLKELKLLVDETNCDVLFTLNMISSSLQDQIAMLTYAQSLKIPIKWVELGNEFNNFKNPGRQNFSTVEDYGKTCKQWIDAIKSHFPNVRIAVIGGNRNYNADVKNWNNIVLKNAPSADAIVAHLYPKTDNILDDSGINFQKLFEECYNNGFNNQGFNSIKDKSIWVTEFNINWASNKNNEIDENDNKIIAPKANTWSQTLATLLMTSIATSISPNTTLILNHNISGAPTFAAIESEKQSFQKMPNGIGMSAWLMASDHMNSLAKINFTKDHNQSLQDYELLGWKFSNNKSSSILLVHLLNSPIKINLSAFVNTDATFETKYASKNSIINSTADVKYKTGILNNGLIELPEYSFTIIKTHQ